MLKQDWNISGIVRSLLLVILVVLCGCSSTALPAANLQRFKFVETHMGTLFSITLYAPDSAVAERAAVAAFKRVHELDQIMTDYDPESELMMLCRRPSGKPVKVSADLFRILEISEEVAQKSGGAYDITVGPYVYLWRTTRKSRILPTEGELAFAAKSVGHEKVKLNATDKTVTLLVPNMKLDLGGIAKGLAADEALKVLRRHGCGSALVAASGDIAVGDAPPGETGWKIGIASIETPDGGLNRTVKLHNAGVSTSGDTEQFFEIRGVRYSHIVDPKTGLGLTNRIGATIIGPNATVTDSYDTTISVMGVEKGLKLVESLPGVAALVVTIESGRTNQFESRRLHDLPVVK